MRKGIRVAIIAAICLLLAAAILIGALWYFGNRTDPVAVVPIADHLLGYYDNTVQFDGQVTADNIQSVWASETQTITEIHVKAGQKVKKGDPLLSYETTLSDIQLERKRIAVQEAELALKNAKKDLETIKAMKPYTGPPATQRPTQKPTQPLEPIEELPFFIEGKGTQSDPYRWLWSNELSYDEAFILELFASENGMMAKRTESSQDDGSEPSDSPEEPTEPSETEPTEPVEVGEERVWISFEIRKKNALKGELLQQWGLRVTRSIFDDGSFTLSYAFYEPPVPDEDEEDEPTDETVWVDTSSGYTSAEIAAMRTEKQKEIRDLDLAYRMAKVEYERMKKEAENGTVYATVTGTVTRLTDAETAAMEGTPILTVSDGGCYYVELALGEYDSYPIGAEVTVNSWWSGVQTTGILESVSDTPTTGYYYGAGNPNVSRYLARVSVPLDSGLTEEEYVSVQFEAEGTEAGAIYLEDMYIRTENGQSYVWLRDADGLLHQCPVRTGESIWGYTAVYGELNEESWIAFPYGKDVKEGAQTVEAAQSYDYDAGIEIINFG